MEDGFKIICLKCNKEYILKTDKDLGQLIYATGYDGEVGISCDDCGNKIEENVWTK